MKRMRELFFYLLFGGLTTLVNFIVYSLTVRALGITGANAVAWVAAVLFAFFTNRVWVFQNREKRLLPQLVTFVGGRAFSGVLEIFLPALLVEWGMDQTAFDVPGFWAKAAVSILVVVLNYFFGKYIVFKNKS